MFNDKSDERQATRRSNESVSYLPEDKYCRTADIVASGVVSGTTQGN